MTNKKSYRLLKDLPRGNADDVYEWDGDQYVHESNPPISAYWVENNPEWFEEVKEEPPARIEVKSFYYADEQNPYMDVYKLITKGRIPTEKFKEIKRAIEAVVNGDEELSDRIVYDTAASSEPIFDEFPMWKVGVDPFRANMEWETNDGKGRVIMKRDPKGKFIVAEYPARPFSQEKFEADMLKAAELFQRTPLICEECGEFGKHKETCSQSEQKQFQWTDELVMRFVHYTTAMQGQYADLQDFKKINSR